MGALDSTVSKDRRSRAVRGGLPWAQPPAPPSWASLGSLGLSKGGQCGGVPPTFHSPRFPPQRRLHFLLCLWSCGSSLGSGLPPPSPLGLSSHFPKYLSWQIRAWYWNCHPEDRLLGWRAPGHHPAGDPPPTCIQRNQGPGRSRGLSQGHQGGRGRATAGSRHPVKGPGTRRELLGHECPLGGGYE